MRDLTSAFADLRLPTFGKSSTVQTIPAPVPHIQDISYESTATEPFRTSSLAPKTPDPQPPTSRDISYARANNIKSMKCDSTGVISFKFCDLPLEIREYVYHQVFHGSVIDYTHHKKVTRWTTNERFWVSAVSSSRNLLRTSKVIYKEAVNIFWSEVSVRLFGPKYWGGQDLLRFLSRRCRTHLMKLELPDHTEIYGTGLCIRGQRLMEVLPKLSEIRLSDCAMELDTSGDEELIGAVLIDEMELTHGIRQSFALAREIPTVSVYGKVTIECEQESIMVKKVRFSHT